MDSHAPKSYPFAAAPDIIRSQQKDVYFQSVLLEHLTNLLRRSYGARFVHTYTAEAKTTADLLYLGLTTLIGNRTLGEEYCDIVQVEDDTGKLPDIARRARYIVASILVPYGLTRILPAFRARIRRKLEANLRRMTRQRQHDSWSFKLHAYLLDHLATWTSPAPVYAASLAVFYFTGAYYELSKRMAGLRYIFTRRIAPSDARVGYEVLGVLLMVQLSVQTWLHLRDTIQRFDEPPADTLEKAEAEYEKGSTDPRAALARVAHTPVATEPRVSLSHSETMRWIKDQQRKCILCLEELKDPAATQCGHVFCWSCIADWIKEKPECPLCRRAALAQHVLPLRQ